jgi:hypothetical protein
MKVEFINSTEYLTARVIGDWTTAAVTKAIHSVVLELEKNAMSKLLFDFTDLSKPKSELTRYESGVKLSEILYKYKIAGFPKREKNNRLTEMVAANRGANFKMFLSEADAIQWLVKD